VPRENVDLITRMLARARDDPSALAAVLHEDVEFDVAGANPEGGQAFRGPAGARRFFREWTGAFEDWGYDVVEVIDAGDSVVVNIDQWGRGKSSGATVHQPFWQVWTLRERLVVRVTHHEEKADALRAAEGPS